MEHRKDLRQNLRDQDVENTHCNFIDCFDGDEARDDNTRRRFLMFNSEPEWEKHHIAEHVNNINSHLQRQNFQMESQNNEFGCHHRNSSYSPRKDRMRKKTELNPDILYLESKQRFDSGCSHIECNDLERKDIDDCRDKHERILHAFEHKCFEKNKHQRWQGRRKRKFHNQTGICSRRLKKRQDELKIYDNNHYTGISFRVQESKPEYEGICCNYNTPEAKKKSRAYISYDKNTIRNPEKLCSRNKATYHHFGKPTTLNECGADKSCCHEKDRWYDSRDRLHYKESLETRPHEFNVLKCSDLSPTIGDRHRRQNFHHHNLFDDKDDREDEVQNAWILNEKVVQGRVNVRDTVEVHAFGANWCLNEFSDQRDRSKSTNISNTNVAVHMNEKDQLEKRVAMKLKACNRRAQISLLYSKYIKEVDLDNKMK